jgi:hypothetical protein
MCLIIYSPTGKLVDKHVFDYAQQVNSDGIGIMSPNGNQKFVGRKCKKRAWRWLRVLQRDYPSTPYGVHFRWRTHGPVDRANTHPYQVPYSDAFVMHNGVLGITADAKGESDTAKFVREYMPFAPGPSEDDYTNYYERIARVIGYGNKFLVFHSASGRFTLVNEDEGFWRDGLWYSNDYSVPFSSKHGLGSYWDRAWGMEGTTGGYPYREGMAGSSSHMTNFGLKGSQAYEDYPDWEGDLADYKRGNNVSGPNPTTAGVLVDTKTGEMKLLGYKEPTAAQYLAMTPEEQEFADSMVASRMRRDGYYDDIAKERPLDYYDTGHDAARPCDCPAVDMYGHLDGCPMDDDVGGEICMAGDPTPEETLMADEDDDAAELKRLADEKRAEYLAWWEGEMDKKAVLK